MDKQLVTIVIPVYNTDKYLDRTLSSIKNQSLKNIPVIIINDNSSKISSNIIEKIISKYNNITYIKNDSNLGPGLCRNIGIDITSTKYVLFLDSDDWLDTNACKIAKDYLDQSADVDIAIWGIKKELNNFSSMTIRNDYQQFNSIDKNFALNLLCNFESQDINISAYLGNKLFRTEMIKTNNIRFHGQYFEDVAFSFESILNSNEILLIPNLYTHYYQRDSSIMHSFSEKHITDMFDILLHIEECVNNYELDTYRIQFISLVEKCTKTLLSSLFNNSLNSSMKKEFLKLLIKHFNIKFNLSEFIDYIDIERFEKLFL